MEHALLGRTGVRVSRIALGTALLGLAPGEAESDRFVHAAVDLGINVFDCANTYGNRPAFDRPGHPAAAERRHAEELLGKALRGRRDDVLVCTKVGEPVGAGVNDGGLGLAVPGQVHPGGGLSRFHILREVDRSLRRLQTDHIDVYHLHHPDPDTPVVETLGTMDDLVRQGKIRYVGLSDHLGWQMTKAVLTADARRVARPVLNQIEYNLIRRAAEREIVPAAQELGVSLTCFSPLAGGALAGLDVLERPFGGLRRWGVPVTFSEEQRDAASALETFAKDWGQAPAHLALRWLLDRRPVAAAIIGPESVEELAAVVGAVDVVLEPEQVAALDKIGRAGAQAR
ncbi:aldo/keto reductase [Streptomyces sp. T028]|uniref:aldo/keto reductase n=1 Tax=Streptomyces sp. T028 TaxID=3394379 RepID=UPI003A850863